MTSLRTSLFDARASSGDVQRASRQSAQHAAEVASAKARVAAMEREAADALAARKAQEAELRELRQSVLELRSSLTDILPPPNPPPPLAASAMPTAAEPAAGNPEAESEAKPGPLSPLGKEKINRFEQPGSVPPALRLERSFSGSPRRFPATATTPQPEPPVLEGSPPSDTSDCGAVLPVELRVTFGAGPMGLSFDLCAVTAGERRTTRLVVTRADGAAKERGVVSGHVITEVNRRLLPPDFTEDDLFDTLMEQPRPVEIGFYRPVYLDDTVIEEGQEDDDEDDDGEDELKGSPLRALASVDVTGPGLSVRGSSLRESGDLRRSTDNIWQSQDSQLRRSADQRRSSEAEMFFSGLLAPEPFSAEAPTLRPNESSVAGMRSSADFFKSLLDDAQGDPAGGSMGLISAPKGVALKDNSKAVLRAHREMANTQHGGNYRQGSPDIGSMSQLMRPTQSPPPTGEVDNEVSLVVAAAETAAVAAAEAAVAGPKGTAAVFTTPTQGSREGPLGGSGNLRMSSGNLRASGNLRDGALRASGSSILRDGPLRVSRADPMRSSSSSLREGPLRGSGTLRDGTLRGSGSLRDASESLPEGWRAVLDPATKIPYFMHEATKETTWEKPAPPPDGTVPLQIPGMRSSI